MILCQMQKEGGGSAFIVKINFDILINHYREYFIFCYCFNIMKDVTINVCYLEHFIEVPKVIYRP